MSYLELVDDLVLLVVRVELLLTGLQVVAVLGLVDPLLTDTSSGTRRRYGPAHSTSAAPRRGYEEWTVTADHTQGAMRRQLVT